MKKVPIILLSGFLGSGKTTLLTKMLEHTLERGMRPAVIMNEVGDVNLDGQAVNEKVPMRELLSGCICCTISGDLGFEIQQLIRDSSPELILIEATGVANPMEVLDAITEAALLQPIDIRAIVTVVDLGQFLKWQRLGAGKTYHLMVDQIRCANLLLLNKSDLIPASEIDELKQTILEINPKALVYPTVQCEADSLVLDQMIHTDDFPVWDMPKQQGQGSTCTHDHSHGLDHHDHSYNHVMVYTHYFQQPIETTRFEEIVSKLPGNVYRAKGIFTAIESGERMMFQYAYKQLDLFRIKPQGKVQDVAVFMGEQFVKDELKQQLEL